MQSDLILTLIMVACLGIFAIIKRKQFAAETPKVRSPFKYILFLLRYNTDWGIIWMEKTGAFLRRWKSFKYVIYGIIFIAFVGMLSMLGLMGYSLYQHLTTEMPAQQMSNVALILPFKTSSNLYVPFFYWIISLMIIMSIHEFAHGILAS
jgi:hypothetical protein